MPADRHDSICHIIDKSLAGGASVQEEQSLREHLLTCAPCREYLAASNRAIAGLQGFSFDMDPELDGRVLASLAVRAQQLEAKRVHETRPRWSFFIALALTVAGSFAASQLGSFATAIFPVEAAQVRFGLAVFWIVPSLFFCLLFLRLPVASPGWMNKKGLSL
jgi:hypothetical protein